MSLMEAFEEALRKTEALTKYESVKEENEKLRFQLEIAENRLRRTGEELAKYKALATEFAGKPITMEEFQKKILDQTRTTYGEEIDKRAKEKFDAESPSLARRELVRLLRLPERSRPAELNKMLAEEVEEKTGNILGSPSLWPPWFKQLKEEEVKTGIEKGLDATFRQNVEEKARTRLGALVAIEWPRYVQNVISPLVRKPLVDQLLTITGLTVSKACDKCGQGIQLAITPEVLGVLLQRDFLGDCPNPRCRDLLTRHRIRTTLGDVFVALLARSGLHPPT